MLNSTRKSTEIADRILFIVNLCAYYKNQPLLKIDSYKLK